MLLNSHGNDKTNVVIKTILVIGAGVRASKISHAKDKTTCVTSKQLTKRPKIYHNNEKFHSGRINRRRCVSPLSSGVEMGKNQ